MPVIFTTRPVAVVRSDASRSLFPAVYAITLLGQQRPNGRCRFPPRKKFATASSPPRGHEPVYNSGRWREFLDRNKRIAGTLRCVRAWTLKFLASRSARACFHLVPGESVTQPDFSHANIFCFVSKSVLRHQKADATFVAN